MMRLPPRYTRTHQPFPYTTLFRPPSIDLVRPDVSEALVPFDVRDEFVVVHLVAPQLRLRRGGEVLCIYNQAPEPYGVDHGTNTGSPHVERTITHPQE